MKAFTTASLVTLGMLASGAASAATVTYTNDEPTPQIQLVIDDSGATTFRFALSTLAGAADFLGLGFNLAGTGNPLTGSSFTLVSATNAANAAITPLLQLFGDDTGSESFCGSGCNFNGAGSAEDFDYILRIGDNGGGPENFVKTVVFDLTFAGSLADNPFSQIAVRAQNTTNPGGSIKTDLTPGDPDGGGGGPSPVPLPAGLPLLLGGLGLYGIAKRMKARKA